MDRALCLAGWLVGLELKLELKSGLKLSDKGSRAESITRTHSDSLTETFHTITITRVIRLPLSQGRVIRLLVLPLTH